jgi:C-terminal processing protease CtpA/Prc
MNARRRIAVAMVLLTGAAYFGQPPGLAAQETDEPRRIGLGFNPREAEPRVAVVEPGSLADRAGLRVYDVIVSLNGRSLAEHGPELGTLMRGDEPLVFEVRRGEEELTLTIGGPEGPAGPYDDVALELADILESRYLFPDRGLRYAESLRTDVRAGAYASIEDDAAFADRVSSDLNALAEDRHLRVSPPGASPTGPRIVRRHPDGAGDPAEGRPGPTQVIRGGSGGVPGGAMSDPVPESGWLTDEVAFMRIGLMPPDPALKAWAASFMEEHAEAEALVLDLRLCRGGTVDMMNGFLPYLFGDETHLLTMDTRVGAAQEVEQAFDDAPEVRGVETDEGVLRWHHVVVPSETANRPDMPVYVLTGMTGSACEHLTMALQATGRATVIGSRTAGAGHYSTMVELPGGFSLLLPIGRTYDPRTDEGWELVGIEPDVQVDPSVAEERALELFEESRKGALPLELERVLRDYERHWSQGDAEGLAALFVEDGLIARGGAWIRGRDAIRDAYRIASGPLRLRAIEFASRGGVGYIVGAYGYGESLPVEDLGLFTLTLRRDASGRWLIVSDLDRTGG